MKVELCDIVPHYEAQREVNRGRGGRYLRGRHLTYPNFNGYHAYALEQFGLRGEAHFSARMNAPQDSITPYEWICAWVNTDSWAEAVIAAQELDRRLRRNESLGEHELMRSKS